MTKIYPVLLAGGSGTRLWPVSRKSYPKQFSNLIGEKSLFQSSAMRLQSSDEVQFAPHVTITNSDFRFIVRDQLESLGLPPGQILIEPSPKNTAPAILAASIHIYSQDPDAVLLVAPSDHLIPSKKSLHEAINLGLSSVAKCNIVTFGIRPTQPETGYGYLELGENLLSFNETTRVKRFVEKPDSVSAQKMVESGNFLWNSGIFLFRAADMISAFADVSPVSLPLVKASVESAVVDLDFLRLNPDSWQDLTDISIDYEVMEKIDNIVAVSFSSKWTDLGDWQAVWSELDGDENGVVLTGEAHAIECSNSLLYATDLNQQVFGLGLTDIIAVAMPDAVLIAHKDRAQDVRRIVPNLKSKSISQAEMYPRDHRPWGWFESLTLGEQFQVKRIFVKPGAALSLQSHKHRSEHWIVVEGTATVTIDAKIDSIEQGQSVYIPVGAIHRLENKSDKALTLVEVQTGTYFGEDDIIRYEDLYKRD